MPIICKVKNFWIHCGWELIVIHIVQGSSPNHWINSPGSYRLKRTEEQLKKQCLQLNIFLWSILFSVMCMAISIWDGDTDRVVAAKSRVSWLTRRSGIASLLCMSEKNSFLLKYKSLLYLFAFSECCPKGLLSFTYDIGYSHFSLPALEAFNAQFNETNTQNGSRGWQEKIPSS